MYKILEFYRRYRLLIGSFFLACFGIFFIYFLLGIYPFGEKTVLTMDMSGQYVSYLAYFRNAVFGKANLFYNFSMNLGSNCFGLFAYYLSSPLNLILCLFPEAMITEAILVLNIIKIGLCATTMAVYLQKTTHLKNSHIVLFALMYGLMSYNIVYSQNIMWLDGCIYLPLVILGVEKILKTQKITLYVISLFLTILSNFYIGYMVGLFSVLYMIMRLIQNSHAKNIREFYQEHKTTIKKYIKAVIITLLLSMIILLPVFLNLLQSKSEIQTEKFSLDLYYSPFDVFSKMVIGAFNKEQLGFGPPAIYCGSLCFLLMLVYFLNEKIEKKSRISYFMLFLLLSLCFLIVPLDLFFHMLQMPVWFPFRNSFLFSFLMIVVAAKSLEQLKSVSWETFFKVLMFAIFFVMLLSKFSYSYVTPKNVLLTILFLLLTGILVYFAKRKKGYQWLLVSLVLLEMIFNGYQILKQMDYVTKDQFLKTYAEVKPLISKYASSSNSFYRIQNKIARTINDPMLYNYNGFYHYSSLSGKKNKQFLTDFGLRHNLILENSGDTTLPMASILGVLYYMNNNKDIRDVNLSYYQKVDPFVYQNQYALPLGFLVSNQVKNVQLKENAPLDNQNELFRHLCSIDENIFEEVSFVDRKNIKKNFEEEWYLVYSVSDFERNSVKIYFDDVLYKNNSEVSLDVSNVLYVPKGVSHVRIESKNKVVVKVYRYLHENFEKIYQEISKEKLVVKENRESYLRGEIDSKEDGVLFTSIIQDRGWKVKVDGKKVSHFEIADHLIALDLTKGKHTVEFSYVPPGFSIGCLLFGIGTILFLQEVMQDRFKFLKKRKD